MRSLFRSAPARLACIAFTLFFLLSLVSRVALLIAARHDVTWDASILGIFAIGTGYDAASAVFATIPWLLLGGLAPSRLWKSRLGRILVL